MKKNAFTLAEVLITLTVIGIVAAMTIPSLMQKTQDAEFKAAWKKKFAELSQINLQVLNDNGGTIESICANYRSDCFMEKYLTYLKATYTCFNNTQAFMMPSGNCWHPYDGKTHFYNGTAVDGTASKQWDDQNSSAGAILNDGTLVLFIYTGEGMELPNLGISGLRYARILVDVNGFKKPNVVGKDIFGVNVLEKRIVPLNTFFTNSSDRTYKGECASNESGWACSQKMLES